MKNKITKSEAMAFRTSWKIVNKAEREELRSMPVIEKFNQFLLDEKEWGEFLSAETEFGLVKRRKRKR